MKMTKRTILLPAALLLLSGCASPQQNEYTAFTEAGSGYADAVTKVLDAAEKAHVDASSWKIVDVKEKVGVVSEKKYRELTEVDEDYIKIIARLQDHAVFFGRYLNLLDALARSDAPVRTKAAIEGVIGGMAALSPQSASPSPVPSAIGAIFVDASIRKELQDELIKRKTIILKELELQKKLLTALKEHISLALKEVKETKERQLLLLPLTTDGSLAKPEEWVKKRQDILFMAKTAEDIGSAIDIVDKMSRTFETLTTDKDVMGRINALISDIERIAAVADALNS
ncbi:MAG: hypothetical protein ACTFAL_01050 [Candidatus Electronema sp. V4]|uniref:hypothetical protein n=1 Tax=Candidatus Electronema sp. V4 TaxID=3454756 RepID=UPI0040553F99